jgi:hypothetical protein
MVPTVEHTNFVSLAVPRIQMPAELDAFLTGSL